jgi:hypothetical protein
MEGKFEVFLKKHPILGILTIILLAILFMLTGYIWYLALWLI